MTAEFSADIASELARYKSLFAAAEEKFLRLRCREFEGKEGV
jgi:hypothetical protein